jgi:hypothetical protein
MRETRLVLALSLAGLLVSCDTGPSAQARSSAPVSKGIVVMNEKEQYFSFRATFHRENATAGTWHLIVEGSGAMAPKAFFTTDVSPGKFYESLKALGMSDGNNVSSSNIDEESIATEGDLLDFSFDWKDQKDAVALTDLLTEVVPNLPTSGGNRGLEMRFGGNYTKEDAKSPPCHESGCLACLYTCSAGVTSNAKANRALLKKEKNVHRYRINPKWNLAEGASIRVIVRKHGAALKSPAPAGATAEAASGR